MNRWPRFAELQSQVRSGGAEACVGYFTARDWRDLQLLSQLAWMDEEYLAKDPAVRALSEKGVGIYSEDDKAVLLNKQHELLAAVLPEYRKAALPRPDRGFHHALLPSNSAAALRHRHRAHLESAHAAARFRLFAIPRMHASN